MKQILTSISASILVKLICLGSVSVAVAMLTACFDLEKSGKAYQTDLTPHMELQAARLRSRMPVARWQTIAPEPEVDEVIPGMAGTTLVSYLALDTRYANSPALVPYYGPYVLYDTASGRELWRHQRDRNPDLNYSVLLTDPYLLYAARGDSNTRIVAVNPRNGKSMWQITLDTGEANLSVNGARGVLAVHTASPAPKLTLLALQSGKSLWSIAPRGGQVLLDFDDDRLLVMSADLTAYSVRDGQRLWRVKGSAGKSHPLTMVAHQGGYLLAWRNGMLKQVSSKGKLSWSVSLAGRPELATVTDKLAIVATQTARKGTLIQALSLASGKPVWRRQLATRLSSALSLDANQLVYTTTEKIESVSITNGRRLFSVPLAGRVKGRLPDHISQFPRHIAVASESMVSAHARNNGREIWRIDLQGTDYLTQAVARSQLEGSVVGDTSNRLVGVMQNYTRNIDAMHARSDFYIKQARQNYTNVYNRTRTAMSSGNSAQRADASFQRSLAASHAENIQKINRSFDIMMLNVNTALNVLASAQAVEENARIGAAAAARDRAYKRLLLSYKIHEAALQGDYYLRPFRSRSGNGLVIVNMRAGSWTEIPSSPSETILEDRIYMNIIPGLIVNGEKLITLGTGLDASKWKTDERFRASSLQSSMFAWALEDRYRTTLILRSLLSYNISDAKFRNASEYAKSSLTRRKSRIIR